LLLLVVVAVAQTERLVVVALEALELLRVLQFLLVPPLRSPLVLVARLVVGQRLIPLKQTGLILFLVQLLQLVAGLVLAVNLLAPLLVMEALGVVRVVILVDLQVAQASPDRALMEGNVLTPLLQKAVAVVVEQAQLA
jgi:hypothetical protein